MHSFQKVWLTEFPWLTYCDSHHIVFCFYCREAKSKGYLTFSKNVDGAFTKSGFSNWKKAKEKFKEHEKSACHREACIKHKASKGPSVIELANSALLKTQELRRTMLLKQLTSLKYLLRQGLAIRGHLDVKGNLYQLMRCRSEDIPHLSQWMDSGNYQSPEIINELIELLAKDLLRKLIAEINSSSFYSLIIDETRNISGKEQLAISLRWVNNTYEIFEDLIGLVEVERTDATYLVHAIKTTLLSCGIPLESCRGQAYDGAANMAGHLNGVAAQIKRDEPRALFVHCLAHSVNLCLQECARQSKPVSDALTIVNELYNFIQLSPKRLTLFNKLKAELAPENPNVKPLCPTRWTVRTSAINSVIKNYSVLLQELEIIRDEFSGEASSKALGLLTVMEKFSTYFGLKLAYLVFVSTEQLAITLQAKNINAQICIESGHTAKNFLLRHRSTNNFGIFYKSAITESKNLTDKPALPRKRRIPRRIDSGSEGHSFSLPEEYFRSQYFEALDVVINELECRFDQEDLKLLKEVENLLIESCNKHAVLPSRQLIEFYKSDINFQSLETQLSMLPDFVKTHNELNKKEIPIKRITSVYTICDLMNSSSFGKSMFTEINKLLCLYLTVPMTSATAERSFSALRRIKDYLRSTMTQKRLNHLIIMHTHKDKTEDINMIDIAKTFICFNDRRRSFFGSFQ